jgi:nucleoside 2-deoxyribosyltransferase
MRKIYVASSWRNENQPHIVKLLRSIGHEVYDFKNPTPSNQGFHWSDVNPNYKDWTPEQFVLDLYSGNKFVTEGLGFDLGGLNWCDTCICLLPCGRSAHLEAGYCIGKGKPTLFYLSHNQFEPELMYLLGNTCVTNDYNMVSWLQRFGK